MEERDSGQNRAICHGQKADSGLGRKSRQLAVRGRKEVEAGGQMAREVGRPLRGSAEASCPVAMGATYREVEEIW